MNPFFRHIYYYSSQGESLPDLIFGENLRIWLEADSADNFDLESTSVNQWNDLSGNGYHLTSTGSGRPAYDAANKRITFNGTTHYLAYPSGFVDDVKADGVGAVIFVASKSVLDNYCLPLAGANNGADNAFINHGLRASNAANSPESLGMQANLSGTNSIFGTTFPPLTDVIVGATVSDGSSIKFYVNGILYSTVVATGSNSGQWLGDITGLNEINMMRLKQLSSDLFYPGNIKAMLYVDREATQAEIISVSSYLNSKFDIYTEDYFNLELWGDNANNPVYQWSSGNQYRDPSRILQINSKFYFWATEYTEAQDAAITSVGIAVFEADNYYGPYTRQGLVLESNFGTFGDLDILTPDVIQEGDTLYMYVTGRGTDSTPAAAADGRWNIFLATCPSATPTALFTEFQDTPVLFNDTDGAGETHEDLRVDAAFPYKLSDGNWRLYYKGVSSAIVRTINYATATTDNFPETWTKVTASNPILSTTPHPEGPIVWEQNNRWYMVTARPGEDYISVFQSADGISGWTGEQVFDANTLGAWKDGVAIHGATFYHNGSEVVAILFHLGPILNTNNVTQMAILTKAV